MLAISRQAASRVLRSSSNCGIATSRIARSNARTTSTSRGVKGRQFSSLVMISPTPTCAFPAAQPRSRRAKEPAATALPLPGLPWRPESQHRCPLPLPSAPRPNRARAVASFFQDVCGPCSRASIQSSPADPPLPAKAYRCPGGKVLPNRFRARPAYFLSTSRSPGSHSGTSCQKPGRSTGRRYAGSAYWPKHTSARLTGGS